MWSVLFKKNIAAVTFIHLLVFKIFYWNDRNVYCYCNQNKKLNTSNLRLTVYKNNNAGAKFHCFLLLRQKFYHLPLLYMLVSVVSILCLTVSDAWSINFFMSSGEIRGIRTLGPSGIGSISLAGFKCWVYRPACLLCNRRPLVTLDTIRGVFRPIIGISIISVEDNSTWSHNSIKRVKRIMRNLKNIIE